MSVNGHAWSPTSNPLGGGFPDRLTSEGMNQAVFEVNGETWAMVSEDGEAPGWLLHRQGYEWAEAEFTALEAPDGLGFVGGIRGVSLLNPHADDALNTTVVIHDDAMMTVSVPDSNATEMVMMGSVIYALSVHSVVGISHELQLWRSSDGVEWSRVAGPRLQDEKWTSVHLTSGHGRLMLSLGSNRDPRSQTIWTTDDGEVWDQLDVFLGAEPGADVGRGGGIDPAPAQSTEFGWMVTSLGERWSSGLYDPDNFRLLISADGLEWEKVSVPGKPGGLVAGPPLPLAYMAGLFVRDVTQLSRDYTLVGSFLD